MKVHQRGDFTAVTSAEKVTIHLTFNGRHFELPDGSIFDILAPGAPVELRVHSIFLNDEAKVLGLKKLETKELLPAGSTVFARVDLRGIWEACYNGFEKIEERHYEFAERASALLNSYSYLDQVTVKHHDGLVRLELEAPLVMKRTGQKAFKLESCPCVIWDLGEQPTKAYSLNHALTLIGYSEAT